jgi:hypothetical protein
MLGNINRSQRKAVGSIIGGVFILMLLMMGYLFYTIGNRAINAHQQTLSEMRVYDIERSREAFKTINEPIWSQDHLTATIQNIGPKLSYIINIGVWDDTTKKWSYDITNLEVWENGAPHPFSYPEPIKSGGVKTFVVPVPGIIENPPIEWTYKLQFLTDRGNIFEVGYPVIVFP